MLIFIHAIWGPRKDLPTALDLSPPVMAAAGCVTSGIQQWFSAQGVSHNHPGILSEAVPLSSPQEKGVAGSGVEPIVSMVDSAPQVFLY